MHQRVGSEWLCRRRWGAVLGGSPQLLPTRPGGPLCVPASQTFTAWPPGGGWALSIGPISSPVACPSWTPHKGV